MSPSPVYFVSFFTYLSITLFIWTVCPCYVRGKRFVFILLVPTALSIFEHPIIDIFLRHGDNCIFSHFPPMLPFFLEKKKPPPPPPPPGFDSNVFVFVSFCFFFAFFSKFLYKSYVFVFFVFFLNLELLKS